MALKVGIQLFSVKNAMAKDPIAAIGEVARVGYKYIETANHHAEQDPGCGFNVPAEALKKQIEPYGSQVISGHVFPMNTDTLGPVIDYYNILGASYLINPMNFFKDRDDVLRACEDYNRAGKRIKEGGLKFCYHNHFHEFQRFGDKTVIELIMENTDPDYVGIQLDTYWATRGGCDPVEFIRNHPDRVWALHQKDLAKDYDKPLNHLEKCGDGCIDREVFMQAIGDRHSIVEIGTGCMDIQKIIDAGNATGNIEYIILEQDRTQYDEMESIRISMECFHRFSGLIWD